MKRVLPTVKQSGRPPRRSGRRGDRLMPPRERAEAPRPLITIAWANHAREASAFALQLCTALAQRRMSIAVLLASSQDDALEGARLGAFLEAGASAAKSVSVPAHGGAQVLEEALDHLKDATIILALGNAVAEFYRPFFSIVVTGHRRQLISEDAQVLRADLEITSASEGLADELAKILESRLAT